MIVILSINEKSLEGMPGFDKDFFLHPLEMASCFVLHPAYWINSFES